MSVALVIIGSSNFKHSTFVKHETVTTHEVAFKTPFHAAKFQFCREKVATKVHEIDFSFKNCVYVNNRRNDTKKVQVK